MPRWVMGLVAAVGITGLLGAGAWVQRNEQDMVTLQSHLKESCYVMCVQRCQRWCESEDECRRCAENCEKECG